MEIAGYYFDPVKKKYFKIQRNHIAPPDSKYSVQAVEEQTLKSHAEQLEQQQRFKERSQRLKYDRRLHHPLTSLQHRLGNTGPGGATSSVAGYYGASLRRNFVLEPSMRTTTHFALSPSLTDTVVMAIKDVRRAPQGPMSIVPIQCKPGSTGKCAWNAVPCDSIAQTAGNIDSLMLTPQGLLAWTESPGATGNTQLHVARLNHAYEAISHVQYSSRNEQKIQLAASPHGDYWVGWTDSAILLRQGSPQHLEPQLTMLKSANHLKKDSLLTVAFKDEWTLMAGHRSGFVNFLDHREGSEAQACRLRHGSPLNALRILKDDHTVLANGLASTALYDLRYTAAPRTSKKSERCSKSFMTFSTDQRTSDRPGLGLDYCPELNLVAVANSQGRSQHHVTLYSTRTGKRVPSALGSTLFEGQIPCLKFASYRQRPPSLLMAPESAETTLTDWAC